MFITHRERKNYTVTVRLPNKTGESHNVETNEKIQNDHSAINANQMISQDESEKITAKTVTDVIIM